MKKVVLTLAVLIILVVILGADIYRSEATSTTPATPEKLCYGYTIIEFGKGIDCNGDTVRLVKINGGQEMVKDPAFNNETNLAAN